MRCSCKDLGPSIWRRELIKGEIPTNDGKCFSVLAETGRLKLGLRELVTCEVSILRIDRPNPPRVFPGRRTEVHAAFRPRTQNRGQPSGKRRAFLRIEKRAVHGGCLYVCELIESQYRPEIDRTSIIGSIETGFLQFCLESPSPFDSGHSNCRICESITAETIWE